MADTWQFRQGKCCLGCDCDINPELNGSFVHVMDFNLLLSVSRSLIEAMEDHKKECAGHCSGFEALLRRWRDLYGAS